MPFTDEELDQVYGKTAGRCYHCNKKIAWKNYGALGERGAWEVDHSNPRSRGGSDYLRNLFPSCVSCNRSKGALTSREFGSGRSLAQDIGRVSRPGPKKKFGDLRISDIVKLTPAQRATYSKGTCEARLALSTQESVGSCNRRVHHDNEQDPGNREFGQGP